MSFIYIGKLLCNHINILIRYVIQKSRRDVKSIMLQFLIDQIIV